MNPTLEQLARYVVQELERGVPEISLYSALRESGWTQEWISSAFSMAKQHAMPANPDQLNIPDVQQPAAQPLHHHSMRPTAKPALPLVPQVKRAAPAQKSPKPVKKMLLILIALLSVVVVGLGAYRTFTSIHQAAQQRVVNDANRREDLSVLLSNLSDYFVTHNSYPTRTQLNTASFLETNGFSTDSVTDPSWSVKDQACTTKDGKPMLAGVSTPDCYAYQVSTSTNAICNNATTPCTKVKVTIYLAVDKHPYSITFDKNTQVDS